MIYLMASIMIVCGLGLITIGWWPTIKPIQWLKNPKYDDYTKDRHSGFGP